MPTQTKKTPTKQKKTQNTQTHTNPTTTMGNMQILSQTREVKISIRTSDHSLMGYPHEVKYILVRNRPTFRIANFISALSQHTVIKKQLNYAYHNLITTRVYIVGCISRKSCFLSIYTCSSAGHMHRINCF